MTLNPLECPITRCTFKDPVIAPDGFTYERNAIIKWLLEHRTSPQTRQPMKIEDLITNRAVADILGAKNTTLDQVENYCSNCLERTKRSQHGTMGSITEMTTCDLEHTLHHHLETIFMDEFNQFQQNCNNMYFRAIIPPHLGGCTPSLENLHSKKKQAEYLLDILLLLRESHLKERINVSKKNFSRISTMISLVSNLQFVIQTSHSHN